MSFGGTSSASLPFGVPAVVPSSHLVDTEKLNGSLITVSHPSSPEASPPSKSVTPAPPPAPPSVVAHSRIFRLHHLLSNLQLVLVPSAVQHPKILSSRGQNNCPISPTTAPSTPRSESTMIRPSFVGVSLGVQKAHFVPTVPSPTSVISTTTPSCGGAFCCFWWIFESFHFIVNSKKIIL